jgi:uncharacterized protein (TIGR00730 family)
METPQFSVCVYCGSRDGAAPVYATAATELGAAIARQGWRLVYGAGDVGLMGRVATAAMAGGAETLGVIPTHLLDLEVGKRDITSLVITETMHERKKVMFMNADAIVVLPGGAGSLDEFFEVLTWAQLRLHGKPIVLLSVDGYWAPLVALIDHVIEQGFASPSLRALFRVADDIEATITALSEA